MNAAAPGARSSRLSWDSIQLQLRRDRSCVDLAAGRGWTASVCNAAPPCATISRTTNRGADRQIPRTMTELPKSIWLGLALIVGAIASLLWLDTPQLASDLPELR